MSNGVRVAGPTQIVENTDHLQNIIDGKVSLTRCGYIDLKFHQLDSAKLLGWNKRINQHLPACGCMAGAVSAVISGLLFVHIFHEPIYNYELLVAKWPALLAVLMISGVAGKLAGSWYQRREVKKIAAKILVALKK